MNEAEPPDSPDSTQSRSRFEHVLFFMFLPLLAGSCLIILPFAGINETKWFAMRIGFPVLMAVFFAYRVAAGRPIAWRDALSILVLAVLASYGVSFLAATNIWLTALDFANCLALTAVFFFVSIVAGDKLRRDWILWILFGIGTATAAYGVAQHFGADFFPWQEHHQVPVSRGVSFFGHATFSASVLILTVPLSLGLAATRRSRLTAAIPVAGAALMLWHLYFTGARGATLSLFVTAIVVVPVYASARAGIRSGRMAVGLLAVLVVGSTMLVQAWREKESDLLAIDQMGGTLRLYGWETASRVFLANPVLGIGSGNYEVVSPAYWNEFEMAQFARSETSQHEVHNEYLEAAAERGALGVMAMLGMIVYALMAALSCWKNSGDASSRRIGLALFAALFAGSLDAVFVFNLQLPGSALIFWVVLGLLSAVVRAERENVVPAVTVS